MVWFSQSQNSKLMKFCLIVLEESSYLLPVKVWIKTIFIVKKPVVIKGGFKCVQGKQSQLQNETPD